MKVVFSYASYRFTDASEGVGGEEIIAWETVSRLARRGIQCHVFSPRIELTKKHGNIVPYPIPGCDYRADPNTWRRRVKAARFARISRAKIQDLVRTLEPDLIHHIVPSYPGFSSSVADLPVPFIWGPATIKYSREHETSGRHSVIRTVYNALRMRNWKRTLERADIVLLEVEDALRSLPESVTASARVIHSGVDTDIFQADYIPNRERPVVLYLTAVRKNKGAHVLLEAIPAVASRHPNVVFRFVGKVFDPPFFDTLVDRLGIGEHVEFAGPVPHDQIPEVYGGADIYCLPSLQDNAPLSLLEAMSCSRPVVASSLPGIREVFSDPENGRLVKPGDSNAIAEAVSELLSAPDQREQIARANRRHIESSYSWDAHIEQILDVYASVTSERS